MGDPNEKKNIGIRIFAQIKLIIWDWNKYTKNILKNEIIGYILTTVK